MSISAKPNAKVSAVAALRLVPRTIIALGLVSLCMDTSSEIIHSLLPAFLVTVLGANGLSIGIISKSPLITRDLDVLQRLAARSDLEVYVSLISVDAGLIRKVEVRSPTPRVRLRALRRLTDAGINAGLIVAPILPGITDDRPHLEAVFQAARDAGARFVHAGPLRLYAAVRDRFLPVLEAEFPHLVERYARAYARYSSAPRDYASALRRRIQRLQAQFGLPVNHGMQDRYQRRRPAPQVELAL